MPTTTTTAAPAPRAPRVRAGNAMERARSEILAAAADLIGESGLRAVSMAALARRSRVAKATVYNHFRDRDEVLRALIVAERDDLVAHCAGSAPAGRASAAAAWLTASPVLAGLRQHDPSVLIRLATAAVSDPRVQAQVSVWQPDADADQVTRWLVSFAVTGVAGKSDERPPQAPTAP